jgi:hypothetical protein
MSTSHGETAAYLYMYFFRSQYAITGDPRADRCLLVTERLLLICTCTFSEASMLVPLLVKRKKPSRLRAHGVHKLERMTRLTQYLYYYTYIDRSRLP